MLVKKKLSKNITKKEAEKIARDFINSLADIRKGEKYEILIDQPEIADYFIYCYGVLRRCTDKEWNDYINPPQKQKINIKKQKNNYSKW